MTSPTTSVQARVAPCFDHLRKVLSDALGSWVPPRSRVVYLDYPVYSNVGDLMIYLGTETWLRESNMAVEGRWPCFGFPFPPLSPSSIIICQGGGNFGDHYRHQRFRERVVRHYPQHRIVFLPQSVHYRDPRAWQATQDSLNSASNLHLLFRDRVSLERAASRLPNAQCSLAPDMSAFLHPMSKRFALSRNPVPPHGVISHLRSDSETRKDQPAASEASSWSGDWPQILGCHRYLIRCFLALGLMASPFRLPQAYASAWLGMAHRSVRRAARFYAASSHVTTSRLHGHILASMLGIPNTLYDNSYGKNANYYRQWHADLSFATLADAG